MEPYYTKAEQMYQVHGARGEDPTEPPSSAPYPFPAVSHEPRIQQLHDDLARAGYRPFHAPCGVMLDEQNAPFSACIRCKDCDGFPCLVHAKSDAEVLAVRPALQYPNVTLLTNAKVVKLNTNATGKAVTEVMVERNGEKETYEGGIVVVSAGAANSAKLLLLSANDKHPNGLANGSDQVGRHYMYHNSAAVLAVSKEPNPTVFQKTLGLNDFYFGMKDFEYPMGNIQMVGKSQGPMYRGEKPIEAGLAPMFALDEVAKHAVDFWLSTEDLPMPDNRVTLEQDGNIKLSYTPNNQVAKQKLYDKLKSMLNHLGMHPNHLIPRNLYMKNEIDIGGVAHQAGTCRFGKTPRLGARRELQSARTRQPLRRRHQFLSEHRRGESGSDGDGQRAARRRSSARRLVPWQPIAAARIGQGTTERRRWRQRWLNATKSPQSMLPV